MNDIDRSTIEISPTSKGWKQALVRWLIVPLWVACFAAAVWATIVTLATTEAVIGIATAFCCATILIWYSISNYVQARRVRKASE